MKLLKPSWVNHAGTRDFFSKKNFAFSFIKSRLFKTIQYFQSMCIQTDLDSLLAAKVIFILNLLANERDR